MPKCNCGKEIYEKLKKNYPGINSYPDNFEFTTGREFSTYDFKTKQRGRKPIKLLYSYCPHCGMKYENKENETDE